MPPDSSSDVVVPILVDVSRSMGLADMDGRTRIDVARDLLERQIRPALARRFVPELWTFGDTLERADRPPSLGGDRRAQRPVRRAARPARSLPRAHASPAIVVMSDGGDTGAQDAAAVGGRRLGAGLRHWRRRAARRIRSRSAGRLGRRDGAGRFVRRHQRGRREPRRRARRSIFACSRTAGRSTSAASSPPPTEARCARCSPCRRRATRRRCTPWRFRRRRVSACSRTTGASCWWSRPGARRRVLMIEGAPGFEHSFIKRALAADPGLELDSVVRKGRDATGAATYFVQATGGARAPPGHRLPAGARGALRIRRARPGQRRAGCAVAAAAPDDGRLRRRARRRPARAGREVVRRSRASPGRRSKTSCRCG